MCDGTHFHRPVFGGLALGWQVVLDRSVKVSSVALKVTVHCGRGRGLQTVSVTWRSTARSPLVAPDQAKFPSVGHGRETQPKIATQVGYIVACENGNKILGFLVGLPYCVGDREFAMETARRPRPRPRLPDSRPSWSRSRSRSPLAVSKKNIRKATGGRPGANLHSILATAVAVAVSFARFRLIRGDRDRNVRLPSVVRAPFF